MLTGLRSVDIGVTDVAAQARFYTEVWRLVPVAEHNGAVYLRGTGADHHMLVLHPRPHPQLLCLTFSAVDRAAVDALHARLRSAKAAGMEAPAPLAAPGGGYACSFTDPEGRIVRIVAGDARHADAAIATDRPHKITHVVLNTARMDEAVAFWVEVMGLKVSDRSLLTFLRCPERSATDHHCIAFHPGDAPTLHHIAFEMADFNSVMRGIGRMRDAGRGIEWGPGRHGPGNNVFAYFIGPDDFVIEYTAEVEQVDDSTPVRTPRDWAYPPGRSDLWGATAPPSARMKAAQTKIAFAPGPFRP